MSKSTAKTDEETGWIIHVPEDISNKTKCARPKETKEMGYVVLTPGKMSQLAAASMDLRGVPLNRTLDEVASGIVGCRPRLLPAGSRASLTTQFIMITADKQGPRIYLYTGGMIGEGDARKILQAFIDASEKLLNPEQDTEEDTEEAEPTSSTPRSANQKRNRAHVNTTGRTGVG